MSPRPAKEPVQTPVGPIDDAPLVHIDVVTIIEDGEVRTPVGPIDDAPPVPIDVVSEDGPAQAPVGPIDDAPPVGYLLM